MSREIADKIMKGAREAAAYAQGKAVAGMREYSVHVPEAVDVKAIRLQLNMTQHEFAAMFGFSPSAVKKWEAGQRQPESAARVLLRTIAFKPEVVIEANMPSM